MLILGLILFLGVHSTRMVADGWRTAMIGRVGEGAWKGLYALLSAVGLVLLVWGYGLARQQPVVLWAPPVAMRHVAALLTLVAFILLAAAYVPRSFASHEQLVRLRAKVQTKSQKHPHKFKKSRV